MTHASPERPMDQQTYVAYITRAQQAESVRELHEIATEVRQAHPHDPDAARVADLCQMYAIDRLEQLRHGRRRIVTPS